jgi:hypothetical protein
LDSVVAQLIKEGGGYVSAGLMVFILAGAVKIAQILLKREWDRGDKVDGVVSQLSGSVEKLVASSDKQGATLDRLIDGQTRLQSQLDLLIGRQQRAG